MRNEEFHEDYENATHRVTIRIAVRKSHWFDSSDLS
nr:MAG TPA: hypothetical protein [Caudoviricetes sp.]